MEQHLAHQLQQLVEVFRGRRRNQPRDLSTTAASAPGMPAGFIRLVADGASSTATLGLRWLSITMAGSPFFNFRSVARGSFTRKIPFPTGASFPGSPSFR
jgi:hypothetical protein